MIISHIISLFIRLQQLPVHGYYIFRKLYPCCFCIIIFRQRFPKLLKSQILMIMELHFFVHIYKIRNIYVSERQFRPFPFLLFLSVDNADICLTSRNRVIISMKRNCLHDLAFQIHMYYLVKLTVMHIDSTFMDLMESLFLIHFCDIFPRFFVQKLIFILVDIPHGKLSCRIQSSGPHETSSKTSNFFYSQKNRDCLSQIWKKCPIIQRQWKFCCGSTDMCQLDQQIIRIYNGILTAAVKKPFRFQRNVLIHGKICQNQIISAFSFSSSGASGLLPEGCSGSGISHKYCSVDLSDINSKFQCIG